MTIEVIAIAYGDARNGRSCESCNYCRATIRATMCGLHELPTWKNKVCGTWSNDKRQIITEKQNELF